MEYYPALRKKKILPFATKWMDLEDIKLVTEGQILYDHT